MVGDFDDFDRAGLARSVAYLKTDAGYSKIQGVLNLGLIWTGFLSGSIATCPTMRGRRRAPLLFFFLSSFLLSFLLFFLPFFFFLLLFSFFFLLFFSSFLFRHPYHHSAPVQRCREWRGAAAEEKSDLPLSNDLSCRFSRSLGTRVMASSSVRRLRCHGQIKIFIARRHQAPDHRGGSGRLASGSAGLDCREVGSMDRQPEGCAAVLGSGDDHQRHGILDGCVTTAGKPPP